MGCEKILAIFFLYLIVSDNINDNIIYSYLGLEGLQGIYYLPGLINSAKHAEEGESPGQCIINNDSNNNSD